MINPSLSFDRIEIRRMPGVEDGGFPVENLSEGINIIYGPNASGKTTLSRVISLLLRASDESLPNVSLFARLSTNGQFVTLDYDYGRVRSQIDGVDTEYTPFAPLHSGNRYVLALHDLISVEDRDLAQEILREASGGYDLNAARQQLQFGSRITSKSTNVYRNLNRAREEHRKASREEERLLGEEQELARLKTQFDDAERAREELQVLQKAIEYHELKEREESCTSRVNAFPESVGKLREDECEQVEKLRNNRDSLEQEREDAQRKLDDARMVLKTSPLPDEGVGREVVEALRAKLSRLQDLKNRIDAQKNDVAEAASHRQEALKQLGGVDRSPERPAEIDVDILTALSNRAREEGRLLEEQEVQRQLHEWLGPETATPDDPGLLNEGSQLLTRWLAYRQDDLAGAQSLMLPWFIAAIVTALASVILGIQISAVWFILLLGSAGLVAYGAISHKKQNGIDRLSDIQEEFESLNIGQPERWDPDSLRQLLRTLQLRRSEADLQTARQHKWGDLNQKRQALSQKLEDLEASKKDISDRLGIAFSGGFAELHVLADRFREYFNAASVLEKAKGLRDTCIREYEELREDVKAVLGEYGIDRSDDIDMLRGLVEKLDETREKHQKALDDRRLVGEDLNRIDERIDRVKNEISELFQRLGLEPDQEGELRQWVDQQEDYIEAKHRRDQAKRDLTVAEQNLKEHPELKEMTVTELERKIQDCRMRADEWEGLNTRIIEINRDISNAKKKTQREEKLAHMIECGNALREQREADQRSLVGHVLVEFLADKERTRDRPGVFQRARKLFIDFTKGRYDLEIDAASDPPRFRGIDTARSVGQALEELSSGTRLQLLIAVRMAFLERQEHSGIKIPLLLDETLGNSDEMRADQIISAAIEICRQGRQVFYFTAQHDEVGKWRRLLDENPDVPHALIDLAEVRQFLESERVPQRQYELPPRRKIPAPEGMDWQQYGQVLEIRPLASIDNAGYAHLWFLIDDVDILYHLLHSGINLWGQLENLMQFSGTGVLNQVSPEYKRARGAASVIDHAIRLREIGRGKPVDRQVLIQSGAVSERFIDEVRELTQELSGDGEQLIVQLENGEVKGFGTRKIADLRKYLEDNQYIDPRERLTSEDICEQLRPRVFEYLEEDLLSDEYFRWLVQQVVGEEGSS